MMRRFLHVHFHFGVAFDSVNCYIVQKFLRLWAAFIIHWFYLYVVIYGNFIYW